MKASSSTLATITALLAAGVTAAHADSVWLNGSGLRDVSMGSVVGGQVLEGLGTDGRMTLHNGAGIGSSNSIGQDFARAADAAVDFRITYAASSGYSFTLTTATGTRTLTWGGPMSQDVVGTQPANSASMSASPASMDGDSNSPNGLPGTGDSFQSSAWMLNGYRASSRSFNAISIEATAGRGQLSFSNLAFSSFGELDVASGALASDGLVDSNGNTTNGGPVSSIMRQSVLSDVDLSLRNWMLSGRLLLSGGFDDAVSFSVTQNNAQFLTMVPLPPAAWGGLVALGGVAIASRRRKMA